MTVINTEMKHLQNILDLSQFSDLMSEGKKYPHSSLPWWYDCISSVEYSLITDRTTTDDKLREKAKTYAINYLLLQPEAAYLDKKSLVDEIADKIEDVFKHKNFDQRPLASVVAQKARQSIPENPENRYIKLKP